MDRTAFHRIALLVRVIADKRGIGVRIMEKGLTTAYYDGKDVCLSIYHLLEVLKDVKDKDVKALVYHEAGHGLDSDMDVLLAFSDPKGLPMFSPEDKARLRDLLGWVEDARIEQKLSDIFDGVGPTLEEFYARTEKTSREYNQKGDLRELMCGVFMTLRYPNIAATPGVIRPVIRDKVEEVSAKFRDKILYGKDTRAALDTCIELLHYLRLKEAEEKGKDGDAGAHSSGEDTGAGKETAECAEASLDEDGSSASASKGEGKGEGEPRDERLSKSRTSKDKSGSQGEGEDGSSASPDTEPGKETKSKATSDLSEGAKDKDVNTGEDTEVGDASHTEGGTMKDKVTWKKIMEPPPGGTDPGPGPGKGRGRGRGKGTGEGEGPLGPGGFEKPIGDFVSGFEPGATTKYVIGGDDPEVIRRAVAKEIHLARRKEKFIERTSVTNPIPIHPDLEGDIDPSAIYGIGDGLVDVEVETWRQDDGR